MKFSLLILSHNRPELLCQAIQSARCQTLVPEEILIVDSGEIFDHPSNEVMRLIVDGVRMVHSNETESDRDKFHIPSWVTNRFVGETRGDWIAILCDDDLLLPTYFKAFSNCLIDGPDPTCLYTGEFRVRADDHGHIHSLNGVFGGTNERGPGEMDCHVDYLQFIFNRPMWNALMDKHEGKPIPEEKSESSHADGIFMERAVQISKAKPVPGIHCFNRRTPSSSFCGS